MATQRQLCMPNQNHHQPTLYPKEMAKIKKIKKIKENS